MLAAFVAVWLSVPSSTSPELEPAPASCGPLLGAALRGDDEAVQRLAGRSLLGLGKPAVPIEATGYLGGPCNGRTALMIAAEHGRLSSLKILISSGARLDTVAHLPELGDAPFDARCLAIANGNPEVLPILDKAGARPMACEPNAWLFNGLHTGDAERVGQQILAQPSAATLRAALLSQVGARSGKMSELLLGPALAANVDFGPVYSAAITRGDIGLINRLSSGSAKVKGSTELSLAINLHRSAAIVPLVAAGATTNTADVREAVLDAVRDHDGGVLRGLLSTGYRGDDETPLLLYAVRYYPAIVPELVQAGVGLEVDDASGATPLMAAVAINEQKLVELLLARGASARTADITCETALDSPSAPQELLRRLTRDKATTRWPNTPGRAARRMGITCGPARLRLDFNPDQEVFLPNAEVPMRAGMDYRLDGGEIDVRVRTRSTGLEHIQRLNLLPGQLILGAQFFQPPEKPFDPPAPPR